MNQLFNITFLRHGESEGNLSGLIQGQSDYPLTKKGEEQAGELATIWKSAGTHFDLIISSPLIRASQTAEIIADTLNIPIKYEPLWMERNFGLLQGKRFEDIEQHEPTVDFFHPYEPVGENGESQVELYSRASLALQKILRLPAAAYLVVSHGGILNKALYVIMEITPQAHYNSPIFSFGNIGYAQFSCNPASRQWALLYFVSHYKLIPTQGLNSWKID
jgi:broad specificity phosphatase PhoE